MKKLFVFLSFATITQSVFADMACDINVSNYRARYEINSYTCLAGEYLPAHTLGCEPCSIGQLCNGGTFDYNETENQGIHGCASGYFLPANTTGCVACPTGFTCSGGTFDFDADNFQGISFTGVPSTTINNICAINFPTILRAKYAKNTHSCTAGQYLPAGVDACTQCPANSYCVGGTYSFNENINQGIATCDNGYHSSAGASSCEPNIIQITWQGAELADVLANHAETCTYGGDVRTPVKAIHIPGMTFVGWTVAPQQ